MVVLVTGVFRNLTNNSAYCCKIRNQSMPQTVLCEYEIPNGCILLSNRSIIKTNNQKSQGIVLKLSK